ncbi:PLP-dependent aminotransferase family protein [Cupriavidus consociatus]|uniref:MocR-like pyridoxine biosynthesis transcription factor PdxR n=1 Tax=Cupriavidus consociatus TaxID=2821357 RepID=UPI001AE9F709|nr:MULTISPECIES: PLP-dependent aminotransferase family protein [unclassified Cupriavidus]MBP0619490.1 PLP-dependent aminotransferase family protein [Cupriavidus sp. LEh25]MDK2656138.1 PLP-dependent aminotransferase family protein [Cupriavidus sp. LEh21]
MGQFRPPGGTRPGATGAGRRIYDLLRAQIADGSLPPGAPAPSTRALAAELAVSRTTVTAAYEQLAAEGFLVTSAGRAARVASALAAPALPASAGTPRLASHLPLSRFGRRLADIGMPALPDAEPLRFDFRYGAVASRDFPTLAWRRAYQAELLRQQDGLYYAAPEGDPALRRALQGYLRRARGLACEPGQIVVVNGSQQAIDLCARLLLDAGDAFAFEDPGYLMARCCFAATGATCLPTPVDEHGLDTASLPQDERVRLAYVTPSHQFPLGGVLPVGRRMELLQWARRHDAWIVEDDYDGEFRYGQRPIDTLQSIDTDARVIYVGTLSKALSPQLRLGYMVLPAELVPVFRQAKRLADRHAPVLEQRVLAALIESGAYERHVRRMRRENERRRAALLDGIARFLPADAQVSGTAAGLHVVLWLPSLRPRDEAALAAAARKKEVGIYPLSPLFAMPRSQVRTRPPGLVLGYASLTTAQILQGMRILGTIIAAMAT